MNEEQAKAVDMAIRLLTKAKYKTCVDALNDLLSEGAEPCACCGRMPTLFCNVAHDSEWVAICTCGDSDYSDGKTREDAIGKWNKDQAEVREWRRSMC